MNLREIIQSIRNKINPPERLSNETVLGFLKALEDEGGDEITCDELFKKLDVYVERQADQRDAALIMPLIREHLDTCAECCEEYEALLHVIEGTAKNQTTG